MLVLLLVLLVVVKAALRPSVVVAICPGVAGGIIHGAARHSACRLALSILSSHGGWLIVMVVVWLLAGMQRWHPWWFGRRRGSRTACDGSFALESLVEPSAIRESPYRIR